MGATARVETDMKAMNEFLAEHPQCQDHIRMAVLVQGSSSALRAA
jgi:hypothetical protein